MLKSRYCSPFETAATLCDDDGKTKIMQKLTLVLKRVVPFLMVAAVLMQALNKDLVAAAFYLNQRYIAENLCENIGRPEMHCNGICQLKKALQKAAEKEKEATSSLIKVEVQICERWPETLLAACFGSYTAYQYPTDYLLSPLRIPNDIFRPPIGC